MEPKGLSYPKDRQATSPNYFGVYRTIAYRKTPIVGFIQTTPSFRNAL